MPPSPIEQTFDLALQHHEAGRTAEAQRLYRQILSQDPQHVDALHYLGVLEYQQKRPDEAIDLIRRAIALDPEYGQAYTNLGIVLTQKGEGTPAIAAFERAIALDPEDLLAHQHLAPLYRAAGQFDQAVAICRKWTLLDPHSPIAHGNLGISLKKTGQIDEAINAYRHAVAIQPNLPETHYNLGLALKDKGDLQAAVAAFEQSLALRGNNSQALNNLGNVQKELGQLDDAISAYFSAVALKPDFPEAQYNLAIALKERGRLDEALNALQKALAARPNYPEAENNLGNVLKDQGQLDQAIAAYRRAIDIQPTYAEAHSNLILCMQYHPAIEPSAITDELRRWDTQHAAPLRESIQPHPNDRDPNRRLRIGYVSSDFRTHASAHFLVPLFEHHDAAQVELFCYAQLPRPDAMTLRLQARAAQWRTITALSDEEIARQIREDQIDILVDLKLHTAENRLLVFARKPAPLQVSWLGFPGSPGLRTIDYRLSDPYLDPSGFSDASAPEQTLRLPDCFWCYDPLDSADIEVTPLSASYRGFLTFGCLNNFCKINEVSLSLWAKIMRQVQGSRLVLLTHEGSHRERTLNFLAKEGIDRPRIEFTSPRPRRDYLALYEGIDISLDSFPYNGHTTGLDSLWMGVPIITLSGPTPVSRAGTSLLSNLGLTDLIAQSADRFVQKATELASDLPKLQSVRSTLRQRMQQSPLMDAPRFARSVEGAYRHIWRDWCAAPFLPTN